LRETANAFRVFRGDYSEEALNIGGFGVASGKTLVEAIDVAVINQEPSFAEAGEPLQKWPNRSPRGGKQLISRRIHN
jgi:hypothetical protein